MVRKVSITLHDDGMATVGSDILYTYPTYERGLEVLKLIVLSLSERAALVEVPLTPDIEKQIAAIIAKHKESKEKFDATPLHTEVSTKPEPVKKAPAKKRGGNHSKGNKYGIPSSLYMTDKKRYNVLWARCKKHGITYEEALKRDGIKRGRTTTKTSTKPTKLVVASPENPAPIPPKSGPVGSGTLKIREWLKVVNGPITVGTTVKYNGPKASPFFGKVGEITKIGNGNQVLVNFGESSIWLPQSCIFVVKEVPA